MSVSRQAALLLTLSATCAAVARAQSNQPIGRDLAFAVATGPMMALPDAFSSNICATRIAWSLGARLGVRIAPRLRMEGAGSVFFARDPGCESPPLYIRPTGADTVSYDFYPQRLVGTSFTAVDLRVAAEIIQSERVSARLFGGVGRMPDKSLNAPVVGAELAFGTGNRFTIEVEEWLLRMTDTFRDDYYMDGRLVTRRDVSRIERRSPIALRFGAEWPLGR